MGASRTSTTTTRVTADSTWKLMPGRYTREGDVRPLLRASDDMFVVSRPGRRDRAVVRRGGAAAAARRLDPDVPALRRRLQQGDGHQLRESRTSAAPLPFHAMTRYPYPDRRTLSADTQRTATTSRATTPGSCTAICRRSTSRRRAEVSRTMAMTPLLRYSAAACQTDLPNPARPRGRCARTPIACCR